MFEAELDLDFTNKLKPSFQFAKKNRLLKRSQFLTFKTTKNKSVINDGSFLTLIKPNQTKINRLGISVGKKVAKKAVFRNKLKRRLREYFRLNQINWKQGYDFLIIARPGAQRLSWKCLVEKLNILTTRKWPKNYSECS